MLVKKLLIIQNDDASVKMLFGRHLNTHLIVNEYAEKVSYTF